MYTLTEERKQILSRLFLFKKLKGKVPVVRRRTGKDSWSELEDYLYESHFVYERYVPNEVLDIPLAMASSEEEAYVFAHAISLACLERKQRLEEQREKEVVLLAVA